MARRKTGFIVWQPAGGVYYVRFRHAGHRHKVSLRTVDPREAHQRAAQVYAETVEGRRQPRRVVTATAPLLDLAAEWLASLEGPGGLDPRTVSSYLGYARRWGRRWETLPELTALALKEFVRARLGEVARASVRKEVAGLRGFLRWAHERGLLPAVPPIALPLRSPGTRQRTRRPVPLSPAEVRALLAALPERSPRPVRGGAYYPVQAYAEFLYETGLRSSTVARLVRGASWDRGRTTLRIDDREDKAQWGRELPLSRRALELLEGRACQRGEPLWGYYRLDKLFRAAARSSGLDPDRASRVVPYDLRHARLTHLSDAGAARSGLQLLAGHRAAGTTDHYLHPQQSAAAAALAALEEAPSVPLCGPCRSDCKGLRAWDQPRDQSPAEGPLCEAPRGEVSPRISGACAQGGT